MKSNRATLTISCGACAVDGGHEYLRRLFKEDGCYTDISVQEDIEED